MGCNTDDRLSIKKSTSNYFKLWLRRFMDAWDTIKLTPEWEFVYSIWLNQVNRENMEIMAITKKIWKAEVKIIQEKTEQYMKDGYLNFLDLYKKVHAAGDVNDVINTIDGKISVDKLSYWEHIPVDISRDDIIALEYAHTIWWYKNAFEQWFWKWKPKITSTWEKAYNTESTFFDNTINEEQQVRWSNIFNNEMFGKLWKEKSTFQLFQEAIDNLPSLITKEEWYAIGQNFHSGRVLKILWDANPELDKVLNDYTEFNRMFNGVYTKWDYEHIMTAFYHDSNASMFFKILSGILRPMGTAYKLLSYTLNPVNGMSMFLNTLLTNQREDYTFKKWIIGRFWDNLVDDFMKENNILDVNLWWEIQWANYIGLNDNFWVKLNKYYKYFADVFKWTTGRKITAETVQRYAEAIAWWAMINVPDIMWDYGMKKTAVMRVIADKWYDFDTFSNFLKSLPEGDKLSIINTVKLRASEIYKSVRWFDSMIAGNVNGKIMARYMATEWFLSSWGLNKMRGMFRDSLGRAFKVYRDTIIEEWNKLSAHANAFKYMMQDENITGMFWLMLDTYNKTIKVKRLLDNWDPEPTSVAWKISQFIETMSMMSMFFQGIGSNSMGRLVLSYLDGIESWYGWVNRMFDQFQRDFLKQTKVLWPIIKQVRMAQTDPNRSVRDGVRQSFIDMSTSSIRYMADTIENYNWLDNIPIHQNGLSMLFQVTGPYKRFVLNASNMAKKMEKQFWTTTTSSRYENSLISNIPLVKALAYLNYDMTSDEEWKKFITSLTTITDSDESANKLVNDWVLTWTDENGTDRTILDNLPQDQKLKTIDFIIAQMTTLGTPKWAVSVTDIAGNSRTTQKIEAVGNIIKGAIWEDRFNALNNAYMTNTVSKNKDLFLALWAIAANKDYWLDPNDLNGASAYLVSYMTKSYIDQNKALLTKAKIDSPMSEYTVKLNAIKIFGNAYVNADRYWRFDIYARYIYDTYPNLKNFFQWGKEWTIKDNYLVNFKWQLDQALFVQMIAADKFREWDMDASQLQNALVKQKYTMTPEWRIALNMYLSDEFEKMSPSEEDTINFNTILWLSMRDILNDVVTNKDLQTKYPWMVKWLVNSVFKNDAKIWQLAEAWNMDEWSKAMWGSGSGSAKKFKSNAALYSEFKALVNNNRWDLFKLTKLSDAGNQASTIKSWRYAYTPGERKRRTLLASNVWAAKSEELIKPRAQWKESGRTFKWKLPSGRSTTIKPTKSKSTKSTTKWRRKTKKS